MHLAFNGRALRSLPLITSLPECLTLLNKLLHSVELGLLSLLLPIDKGLECLLRIHVSSLTQKTDRLLVEVVLLLCPKLHASCLHDAEGDSAQVLHRLFERLQLFLSLVHSVHRFDGIVLHVTLLSLVIPEDGLQVSVDLLLSVSDVLLQSVLLLL